MKAQEQPCLPGIEESGIPGKDYIPVEWVDACEKYGKWKIIQQEQPEENKLPSKRTRVNYAICKLQSFKPLREDIVLDDYVYDGDKCYRENLLNYIHAIPETRLTEIRSYLKEKGWWPYDDDSDWGEQEQPEQPEVELEKEIDRVIDDLEGVAEKSSDGELIAHLTPIEHLKGFARHFAKWGAEHLKK